MKPFSRIVFSLVLISLFTASCKTKSPIAKEAYFDLYLRDTIPFTLASHEEVSEKLIVFLPPALDTVHFEETSLYKELYKAGYDILCAYQPEPRGPWFYSRKAIEFKGQQIQNVQNLINYLRKGKRIAPANKTILIGVEQGVYMSPMLMANNGIDTAIFINASPFSVYMSLERIASGRMEWNENRQKYISKKLGVDSLHVFRKKVKEVEEVGSELYSLGSFSNMYWLSYHANYMLEEYSQVAGHCHWIQFDDYPFFKESDFEYLKLLDKTRKKGSGSYTRIQGFDAYNEDNWTEIEAAVLNFLIKE